MLSVGNGTFDCIVLPCFFRPYQASYATTGGVIYVLVYSIKTAAQNQATGADQAALFFQTKINQLISR